MGASGKKTKARCHCGRGLVSGLCSHSQPLVLVRGRFLKICVEFPFFPLETNKKAKSTFPFPSRPKRLKFPGMLSFPFLHLPKVTLCGEFGERLYFIRFDSTITKDNWVRLSSQRGEAELVSRRGGGSGGQRPARSVPTGDNQGRLRYSFPPCHREHPELRRAQSFPPNFV